jgi:hypothetical protein
MSDSNKRPAADVAPPPPSLMPLSSGTDARSEAPPSTQAAASQDDPTFELKRRLEETRLPSHLKEQILAVMPPSEERERLFRELQEQGGLSSEEFFASLGLKVEPQP